MTVEEFRKELRLLIIKFNDSQGCTLTDIDIDVEFVEISLGNRIAQLNGINLEIKDGKHG